MSRQRRVSAGVPTGGQFATQQHYASEVSLAAPTDSSTMRVNRHGDMEWRNAAGEYHREDGPAIENANGAKQWFRSGTRHRDDGPAIERPGGNNDWYRNGKLHRDDGPAIDWKNSTKQWYRDGERVEPPEQR